VSVVLRVAAESRDRGLLEQGLVIDDWGCIMINTLRAKLDSSEDLVVGAV